MFSFYLLPRHTCYSILPARTHFFHIWYIKRNRGGTVGLVKDSYSCPLMLAMDLVGGKWKMVILWHLRNGTLRFNELRRLMPGITQKMLTQQLRELEDSGIINRTVYPVMPPKVEYDLTDEGKNLIPSLDMLCEWTFAYADTHGITAAQTCTVQTCSIRRK